MLALQASARWGARPTYYLGTDHDPAGPWSLKDRALAEGLVLHEQGLGPHGLPLRVTTDEERAEFLEVEEVTDYGAAKIAQWHEAHKKPAPGVTPVLVDRHAEAMASRARRERRAAERARDQAD